MFRRFRPSQSMPARGLHRLGAIAVTGAATVAVLVSAAATGSAAQPSRETLPPIEDLLLAEDDPPPPTITISPNISAPVIPLPGGDDGPIYTGPIIPLPSDDDGPIFTGPTIPLPPGGDDPGDSGPTLPPTDDTDPTVDPAPDDTATTAPTPETPAPTPGDSAEPSGDIAPFLVITSATVDCAGVVHVTYETGALPEPAPEGEHVVMFSPATDPTSVVAHRIAPRPINSIFTVDMQSAAVGAYRIYVVADFEPATLDGVLLVDEADATAPVDCPAAPTTTALPPGPTSVAPTTVAPASG